MTKISFMCRLAILVFTYLVMMFAIKQASYSTIWPIDIQTDLLSAFGKK